MEIEKKNISAQTLRSWLEEDRPVFILDVRPNEQRAEWQIPGSHYLDAYKRLNEGDNTVLDEIDIPGNTKVVTVCAAGRISEIASEALRQKGIDAMSLEGGMKAWGTAWNEAEKKFDDFEVLQIRRTGKGCLSYLTSSNNEAIIIDASLPVEVYAKLLQQYSLTVKYVIETHIHADHLSRSKEAASYFHVPLFLPVPNSVQFPYNEITLDTIFSIGAITLQSLPTPGHTLESASFYIKNNVLNKTFLKFLSLNKLNINLNSSINSFDLKKYLKFKINVKKDMLNSFSIVSDKIFSHYSFSVKNLKKIDLMFLSGINFNNIIK